jgi:putative Holliday junction resolvase
MRSLGLDIGDKRIGVALSDPGGILASPLTIIDGEDEGAAIEAITDIINEQQVMQIVVGLPRSMDGTLGRQAEKVKDFIQKLCEHVQIPVEYRDERLTTVMAERLKRASGGKKAKERARSDAQAAAIILQGYLDEGCEPGLT